MDYMKLAKWLAITVLVLYLVVKGSLTFAIPVRILATVYDDGPYGYTLLVKTLRDHGNRVYLTLPDPLLARHQVLLILDPLFCSQGYLGALRDWIAKAAPRVILVVGSSPCAPEIADWLSGARSTTVYISNATIDVEGLRGPTFLSAVERVEGGTPIGIVEGHPGVWPGYRASRVVYIGGSDMLRNRWLASHPENVAALERIMGCGRGGCIVVIPSVLETGAIAASINLYPLALLALSILASIEKSLYRMLDGILVVAYVLLAGALAARYMSRGAPRTGRESLPSRPEPPAMISETEEFRAVVEKGLKALEPRETIKRLYVIVDAALRYKLGASVNEVIENPELLAALSRLTGLDSERIKSMLSRLYKLYRRARGETYWPPIVLWGRASRRLLLETDELLKRLGVGLHDVKSLEVALELA